MSVDPPEVDEVEEGYVFDHHSPEFAREWPEVYRRLRASCPVAASPRHGGFHVVTRYDDVRRVLEHPEIFASGRELHVGGRVTGGATVPVTASRLGMMEMDPPVSLRYRRLVTPFFSARNVRAHEPLIRAIVHQVLDERIEHGSLDVVAHLGAMVPPLVIVDLLGLPRHRWRHYADALHQGTNHERGSAKTILAVMQEMHDLVSGWRATGSSPPGVCRALLGAEVDGAPIPDDLVAELVFMLLTGGVDTTTAQIANVVDHLDTDPALRARLQQHPEDVAASVDELLRLYTPGVGAARTVVEATALADVALGVGDRVLVGLGSGNRDETVFDRPDEADPDRPNAHQHLSFGLGVHRCVGAHLAKAELIAVVQTLLERTPDFRVERASAVRRERIPLVNGWTTLPIRFAPGRRRTPDADVPPLEA